MRSILVQVRREPRALVLRYVLSGEVSRLRVPAPRAPARVDGLWRTTCFELFLAPETGAAYREFNFSPSGEWAAYGFGGYREGGAPLECPAPVLARRQSAEALELEATVALAEPGWLRLGLSTMVEHAEGGLSYWALRHPAARPDFHHPDALALEVDEARH